MESHSYASFKVEIVEKIFCTETGIIYPKTAILSFFNAKNQLINSLDYGYLDIFEIYEKIHKEGKIILDYCYVFNFSMRAYRLFHSISRTEIISFDAISAEHTFFNSNYTIDFSYLVIKEKADFKFAQFANGYLNFSHSQFANDFDFGDAFVRTEHSDFSNAYFEKGNVNFKNTIFLEGEKNFQYADFGKSNINFTNVDFGNGNVLFINTNFSSGVVSFKVARFGDGDVDFHYSKFADGDISFERSEFGDGTVNFAKVEFGKGRVNFNRSVFKKGDKIFEGIALVGKMSFKKALMGEGKINFELAELKNADLNFEKADLGNNALSFLQAQFRMLLLSGCHIRNYLDLRVKCASEINLSDTIIHDIIDFKPYEFSVCINCLNISGMRLLGTIYIDWKTNGVLQMIENQENTTFIQKAYQFFILKESFHKVGQYNDEDSAYVWFKRYEAKADYEKITEKKFLKKLYYSPVHWLKNLLFDHAGLYATNPTRVLISMIVAIFFFGILYSVILFVGVGAIGSSVGGDHNQIGIFGRSMFHSGITFFTIGYGDFYPLGAVRWLSNVEGFIGVALTSYFTVAFVRKILR